MWRILRDVFGAAVLVGVVLVVGAVGARLVLGFPPDAWLDKLDSGEAELWLPVAIVAGTVAWGLGVIPHWPWAALLAVPPALWGLGMYFVWWDDRRVAGLAARGLCVGCEYDLRGTPGRCPECGRVVGEEGAQVADER